MALITAYRSSDGSKVRIPEHWLGHKTLGRPFRKTKPSTTTTQSTTPAVSGGAEKKKES